MTKNQELRHSKKKDYCYNLQPIADHQAPKIPFRDFKRINHYVIGKILPNNEYVNRRINANNLKLNTELDYVNTITINHLMTPIETKNYNEMKF